jgi:hypothetical protein
MSIADADVGTTTDLKLADFTKVDCGVQLSIEQFARPARADGLPAQFAMRQVPFGQQQFGLAESALPVDSRAY